MYWNAVQQLTPFQVEFVMSPCLNSLKSDSAGIQVFSLFTLAPVA